MNVLEEASRLHEAGQLEEAEKYYEVLLAGNATHPDLLASAGTLFLQKKRYGLAAVFLEASMKYGRRTADVMSNLALAYKYTGQVDKTEKLLIEAMKHNPGPETLANYAGMYIESGNQEEVIRQCKEAIKRNPKLPIAHWNMALALLAQGKWEQAWDEHEWGLMVPHMRGDRKPEDKDIPVWDGSPNKTVWVWGEQGIGDEIMFASMLEDMQRDGCKIIFECHKRLINLFERSFPDVICYGTREDLSISWHHDHDIDARIAIGSLGKFYRRSRDKFPGTPYLTAEPLPKGEKFRVGISWTGGFKAGRIKKRTIPLSWWKPILGVNNVEFVSLQYTNATEEIDVVNALGYDIKQMDDVVKAEDYYETAKLVKSCDLVISCCTSVIHLAGALGVPCWVMTPKWPAWRYQNEGGMPWYRSVRLYRQPETGSDAWIPVINRVALDLDEKVNGAVQVAA